MTTRTAVVAVVLAMAFAATGAGALQAGATPQQQSIGDADVQQQVTQPDGQESFSVVSVSAPDSAAAGENVSVVALVRNPALEPQAQQVEFRVEGDVVARERVAVDGDGVESVRFTLDTSGLDPGDYVHSVYTEGDGVDKVLTISESFEVSDLDAPENVTAGDSITVNATVSNPNDFETTQSVLFRFDGSVLSQEEVTLSAGNSTTFSAQADTAGVAPGTYTHGVFARDTGEIATIDVAPAPGIPTNASVAFSDQESDGTSVTVDSVALPEGGFVVIHDDSLLDGDATGSVVGVSEYLEPGTQENVTVTLFDVPGAEFNETELTEDQTLIAMPHLDTNDDEEYDFVSSNGFVDLPYALGGSPVTDAANVTVPQEEPTASVSFSDQESDGTSVTVDSVDTSDGGFVVIHDDSLLEGDAVGSVIGVSEYLEPGTQENVTVTLFDVPGAEFNETELTEDQTLIAMPHLDTNGTETYDFVTTGGADDGPYTSNGSAVTDPANVTLTEVSEPPTNDTDSPDDGEADGEDGGEGDGTDESDGSDGSDDTGDSDGSDGDDGTDDSDESDGTDDDAEEA